MDYFENLRNELNRAYAVASEARAKGVDPEDVVEIKIAKDVAARVEGITGPPGIAEVIREMEKEGMNREEIAFKIAERIAKGEIIQGKKEKLIEQAVRTGVGLITEGVLVAPTEGIAKVRIKRNGDGSEYVAVYYAGPIRSAGGTAAALSVALADVARRTAGVGDYRATDTQADRYVEEIGIYESRVAHLQYYPPEEHIRQIVKNCPVCIDGDPTEEREVEVNRDVPGVETNRIRGGMPLVVCEGIAQKASKLMKYNKKFSLGWDWLEKIIKIKKTADKVEIKPDWTYLEGAMAGRPFFSHPSAKGGFRLRYGRSRVNGIMGKSIHPATMTLVDDFLAIGTQMKIERPGKGTVVTACGSLEPPVVLLKNGAVRRIRTVEEAKDVRLDVQKVLFLGDLLITFGDFSKSNHPLMPSGWCEEWWLEIAKSKGAVAPPDVSENAETAFGLSRKYGIPLHPEFTYFWGDISVEELERVLEAVRANAPVEEMKEYRLKNEPKLKGALEKLLVEHRVVNEDLVFRKEDGVSLWNTLGCGNGAGKGVLDKTKSVLENLRELSGVEIKNKAPTYIGARMGRPEKAEERKMEHIKINALFPTGNPKNRSIIKIYKTLKSREGEKTVNAEVARLRCTKCKALCMGRKCGLCGGKAMFEKVCPKCNAIVRDGDEHCEVKAKSYQMTPIPIVDLVEGAKRKLEFMPDDVKGVKGLISADKIPEPLEKGFIRAKHDIYVFKDGTCRFDATDVPLTHFRPKELGLSAQGALELGYTQDYLGNKLENDDQIVALMPQDIVLSEGGAEYFVRVAQAMDDMLVSVYGLPPFYKVKSKAEIIGQMFLGLSPHTSAAVLVRVIGYTRANVGYGHPYFHTAKRRNCDADEDGVMLLLDALLNFSRHYLGEGRGGTMDAPIVLTTTIDPREVDDEVHEMELVNGGYGLEFYEAAEKFKMPGEVKIKKIKDVLGTPGQYDQIPITHLGCTLDNANTQTTYIKADSVPEKIRLQFGLHRKIRAVDAKDAAEKVIINHFIPDLYGNLRSFSRQEFRCTNCNAKFRRVPLAGKCGKCGGNLILQINRGGIQKYLEISRMICREFDLPPYLTQRIELVAKEIENIFEDEKVKQKGLSDFL
ncbi:MAG: DNA polymerase II large subunit [Candidatus Bilamarchaeaceae archaeon]